MIKNELRKKMRAQRRAMTAAEIDAKSAAITEKLFSPECIGKTKTVCIFLSAFNEPDTIPIAKKLWQKQCKVVVPISNTKTNTLSLSYIDSLRDLCKGAYGILEPSVIKSAGIGDIDVILIPGLAFDRDGGRMGFGKGYYDRFLENTNAVKIGLCYDFQLLDNIPKESHDIPMNYIITEKEILKIG
ncbi:MAG: 5-formyltetrahydrofolate cyclo-ligase [Clostridia bacterium]|nr:5-formyltetrahydrofolate cyclo-ligase [Clostridia bacterium]